MKLDAMSHCAQECRSCALISKPLSSYWCQITGQKFGPEPIFSTIAFTLRPPPFTTLSSFFLSSLFPSSLPLPLTSPHSPPPSYPLLLFLPPEGEVEVTKGGQLRPPMGQGRAFGELAILYNCTRTATIKAKTDTKVCTCVCVCVCVSVCLCVCMYVCNVCVCPYV